MKKLSSLTELPLSKLLLIGIPLIILGGILIYAGYRSTQQTEAPLTPTSQPDQQSILSTEPAPTPATDDVRLAWFYKPPEEDQLAPVAQNFDFFILTYKDEGPREELKSLGVTAPFAQYLLFLVINDPGGCDENPSGNQVAFKEGDFCQISEQHPDWFLIDQDGNRIQSRKDSYYMDPGNEGFRQFWLERARELQETHGWDEIFLDNVEASRAKMVEDGTTLAQYPDDRSYQQAVEGFLDYIRKNYFEPSGKKIYGNVVSQNEDDQEVWDRYVQHLDGVMIESFATDWSDGYRDPDEWEQQMALVEKTLAQGRTMILVAQGDQEDTDLQNFAYASYLLVNNGNAVFRYTHSESYREVWLYENYNLDLGRPLGNRYQDESGWRRDFEKGHVIVNPQEETAEIVVNP